MAFQKLKNCPKCGRRVLAIKESLPSCGEYFGMSLLAVLTLGIGLVFVLPWSIYRGIKASRYYCPDCGNRCR